MNKAELVAAIAETSGLTKKDSETFLTGFKAAITQALVDGEKVQLSGFGSWETKLRKARKGRNPQTGEEIQIAEKTAVKFKPAKGLNEELNK
jgi:DNA-binding protein HU-beta